MLGIPIRTTWFLGLLACAVWVGPASAQNAESESATSASVEARIATRIKQLGSDSYAARKQAEAELMQIGIVAMDQLQVATLSSDPQIATSALFVQQSIPQNWVWQNDPYSVQQVLDGYGTADATDRASRLDRLALLKNVECIPVLCRIVRYEVSGQLSRLASLRVMRVLSEAPAEEYPELVKIVKKSIGDTQRETALWIRQLVDDREAKAMNVAWWRDRVSREHQLLRANSRETRRNVTIEFYEWVCQQLVANGRRDDAIDIASAMLELIDSDAFRLADACQWAMDKNLAELVEKFSQTSERLKTRFSEEPQLGYLLAESFQKRSMEDQARKVADSIFDRKRFAGVPSQVERLNVGIDLMQRGQFDWAQRELEASLENADLTSRMTLACLETLSEILNDGEKYEQAAAVWKPMVDRIENEPMFAKQINNDFPGTYDGKIIENILSRYHYFNGQAAKTKGDHALARQELRKAIELFDGNVDFLIAMSRIDGDEEWKSFTRKKIDVVLRRYREEIEATENTLAQGGPREAATTQRLLAQHLNESAWLNACTDTNTAEAVNAATKACKLSPGTAAYVDTLARAYFANDQISKAIETQKQALALEPHSRTMKKQLSEFEEALAKSPSK